MDKSKEKQEKAIEEMEEEEGKKEEEEERKRRETHVSLAGIKVAHDIGEIGEGDVVLTLRVRIDYYEGDGVGRAHVQRKGTAE